MTASQDRQNALTRLLGLEYPLIQAPMAGSTTPELVAAVSNAGGLGSVGSAMIPPQTLRDTAARLNALTNKPFNLNFFAHETPRLEGYDAAPMQAALAPFYAEFGLGEVPAPAAPAPGFNANTLELVLELRPRIVSFHFGLPDAGAIRALKDAGIVILGCATTVAEARALERGGADAIIAQGHEAGGHRGTFLKRLDLGTVGTMALVPQVADAVALPVIAAGGIADARGIAAAFMLGASGVQLGTAFLACPEANVHPVHRKALAEASDDATVVTRLFSGRPARAIRNRMIETLPEFEDKAAPFPTQRAMAAPLGMASAKANNPDFMSLWSGQAAALARPEPAAEKVTRLMHEARVLLQA